MIDPSFKSAVSQLMQNLPRAVRAFLQEGKYESVVRRLAEKYGLRVDQGALLESQLMLLLLGVDGPPVFAATLEGEGKIPKDVIIKLIADLDQDVFIPLQKQVLEEERLDTSAPTLPTVEEKREAPSPIARSGGEHLLADHEEAHINVAGAPHWRVGSIPDAPKTPPPAPRPAPNLPRYGVPTPPPIPKISTPVPRPTPLPPPNLPGAMPGVEGSGQMAVGSKIPPIKNPIPPQPKAPIIDKYSVDPYREPPE